MKGNWETKRLADFVVTVSTGPFGSMLHKSDYAERGVPLVNPINIVGERIVADPAKLIKSGEMPRLRNYILKQGDVVVGRRGEMGRCAVVGPNENGWICGTGSFFIRPSKAIDPYFLAHLIRSNGYRERLEQLSTGATMKNLSNRALGDLSISVPLLPEQQRVVGILDQAFDGIAAAKANAEKNLQNARALFSSHLHRAFSDVWSTSEIVALSDLATNITDGDHLPPPKSATGVPFITIGNIVKESRDIDFSNTFRVPEAYFQSLKANRRPQKGDVLYTVTGSFGIPVLVKNGARFCFQRHIGLVRPMPGIDSKWLYYLLSSPQVFKQADDGATGTAQKTVSLKLLRGFQVPRVATEQQHNMVASLEELSTETSRLESIYQRKLAALDALKKSLLHQAFTGQL